jgi:hypothetical protein
MDPQFLATATLRFTRAAESRPWPGFSLWTGLVAAAVNRGEESSGCATTAITTTTSNMY